MSGLSSRERQALALLALEQTNKQIAYALGISASTVGVLLHRAAQKLETSTRAELTARAKALEPKEPDSLHHEAAGPGHLHAGL